ncbi:MAG TPA: patatin-like protein [Pseudomonadales bacterium]
MIKRELRIAVVIYGGVSLAVYMHGVAKEILKLVRASKVLHEMDRERALGVRYQEGPDHRESDTEAVYFDLLQRINRTCHFRVIVDVIAGASAGAINGVMLGKALVDDAQLDAQTPLWLRDADVDRLGNPRKRFQKWYLHPLLRLLAQWLPAELGTNPETREKLARFVRSSWFQPPFSGSRLCTHFFDALDAMIAGRRQGSCLLPPGQRLDVYASITDLTGYPHTLRLNEELIASDRAHAAYCQLTHTEKASDFGDDNLPALVWAARASSSYAGAFPPFEHRELTALVSERGGQWPGEQRFLAESLMVERGVPASQRFDPARRLFVDGGIVNNKPFDAALAALGQHAADRHVDRYILYIEPDPKVESAESPVQSISYVRTIHAAMSTIPRNQPILDELQQIIEQDRRVQINRRLVEAEQPRIMAMVARLEKQHEPQALSADLIAYLRDSMGDAAALDMGSAYVGYVRRRVWRLTEALMEEWVVLAENPYAAETRRLMRRSIENWWNVEDPTRRANLEQDFLDRFDVTYRIRRLQFVIRRLNQHGKEDLSPRARDAIDEFKPVAYGLMNRFYDFRRALSRSRLFDDALIERLYHAARELPLDRHAVGEMLKALSGALKLTELDRSLDQAFQGFADDLGDDPLRHAFLADYVGFPIYDVLLYAPSGEDLGPDPLTPIHVARVSPRDSVSLEGVFSGLKSRSLMGFLGFFNREYREHDYLWGRLNGADRLVDMVASVAPGAFTAAELEVFKHRLFEVIVAREKRRLYRCDDELAALDALLAEQAAAQSSPA